MFILSEMFVTHNQCMAEIFLKWTADDGNAPIIFATKTVHIYVLLVEFPHMLAQKMYGVCM